MSSFGEVGLIKVNKTWFVITRSKTDMNVFSTTHHGKIAVREIKHMTMNELLGKLDDYIANKRKNERK